jgi:hypothetical protein
VYTDCAQYIVLIYFRAFTLFTVFKKENLKKTSIKGEIEPIQTVSNKQSFESVEKVWFKTKWSSIIHIFIFINWIFREQIFFFKTLKTLKNFQDFQNFYYLNWFDLTCNPSMHDISDFFKGNFLKISSKMSI